MKIQIAIAAMFVAALTGCNSSSSAPRGPSSSAPPTDSQATSVVHSVSHNEPPYVTQLRAETGKLGLDWRVTCEGSYYWAMAWNPKEEKADGAINGTIEEGGIPHWEAEGATQREASILLYRALAHDANWAPKHRPKPSTKEGCLAPIQGGPGMQQKYADADCKECAAANK